ncbi:MAG: hypothetical protein IKJ65_07560, partial [Clostridia bacterium]|nr:hypothetical protein [Clostridia bacterium]
RMNFSSDAIAKIEGLLEVNRDFCEQQMAEKASPASPPNKSAFTQGEAFGRCAFPSLCIHYSTFVRL